MKTCPLCWSSGFRRAAYSSAAAHPRSWRKNKHFLLRVKLCPKSQQTRRVCVCTVSRWHCGRVCVLWAPAGCLYRVRNCRWCSQVSAVTAAFTTSAHEKSDSSSSFSWLNHNNSESRLNYSQHLDTEGLLCHKWINHWAEVGCCEPLIAGSIRVSSYLSPMMDGPLGGRCKAQFKTKTLAAS